MIIISRQKDESVVLEINGAPVEIQVVDINGKDRKARLGVSAPRHISVHTKEAHLAIQKEMIDWLSE